MGVKSFGLSCEDAYDKDDWRLTVKEPTVSPWLSLKMVCVCVCKYSIYIYIYVCMCYSDNPEMCRAFCEDAADTSPTNPASSEHFVIRCQVILADTKVTFLGSLAICFGNLHKCQSC